MRLIRTILAFLLVTACAQVPPQPGADDGKPAAAEVRAIETTGRTGRRVLGLTQGDIRACSGSYEPPTALSPVRTTDLACTGGITGTATIGPDLAGGRSVRWQLETGEYGRASL